MSSLLKALKNYTTSENFADHSPAFSAGGTVKSAQSSALET